jgi:threonylcarbamoyladenosine tRNA methylthiotransferase MtaB
MKVFLRTFGCRANQYDSEAVRDMLERSGHEVVADAREADAAVFNSCAVTAQAEADLRKAVRRAARHNPALRTTIMGCASALPDRGGDRSLRVLPSVTNLVPGADLPAVGAALGVVDSAPGSVAKWQTGTRALLRVQDGCDEHCTFCATTVARGANRSRAADRIIAEAASLAERHSEIVVTGIHIGSYGRDIGSSLGELVERLVVAVPGTRFRLSSVEATEVDSRLGELLTSATGRVAPSLHAPLQSGSDVLLRRMGRHWYTAREYARAVEGLVVRTPVFGLGADIICGFPGETEADHRATVDIVRDLPFTYLHVFPYSERPGTAATRLGAEVAPAVTNARAAELRDLARDKADAYGAARHGGTADVIVLGQAGGGTRDGLTEDYLTVRCADQTMPRGARFSARLELLSDRLFASEEKAPMLVSALPSPAAAIAGATRSSISPLH